MMPNKLLTYLTILLLFIYITSIGCATKVVAPKNFSSKQARQHYLTQYYKWQTIGKIGFVNSATNSGGSANIDWQQNKQSFNITLYGPLQLDSLTIKGSAQQIMLVTSKGEQTIATSPEELLTNHSGLAIPITGLTYWIRGLVSPASTPNNAVYDQYYQLQHLEQDGWTINYLRYAATNYAIRLPEKIILSHQHLRLKFILSKWLLKYY